MLRQFALLDMGIAILPSYLIGNDTTRGSLVRLLTDYRLPQVEINVAYPSRRHLPAKVRTFIDHLVEHFSTAPNHQLGEQWLKDGMTKPGAQPALIDGAEQPVAHGAYAEVIEARSAEDTRVSNGKLVKSRGLSAFAVQSPH
jgi:hypothetical protein